MCGSIQAAFLCVVLDYATHFLMREIWWKGEAEAASRNLRKSKKIINQRRIDIEPTPKS